MLEYIILGLLMNGELSGYDLKQYMAHSTSNFFDASFGSIYPALKRLEGKGLIFSREIVEGGKYKKVYELSKAGKEDFMRWMDGPIDFSRTRPDHLVKVFFLGVLPRDKARSKLQALLAEVEPVLTGLGSHRERIRQKSDIFQFSTLEFGIGYYQYILNWCRELLKQLEV